METGGSHGEAEAGVSARTRARRWFLALVLFGFLTMVTQVGGVIGFGAWHWAGRRWREPNQRLAVVLGVYVLATLLVIPVVAPLFGRVALPVRPTAAAPLAPRSPWFWLTNRHYVRPQLRDVLVTASRRVRERHPGSVVHYLDACFPFWDGFVMIPHWTHRDGLVADVAFCYERGPGGNRHAASPSPIGYGIYEAPRDGEPQPYRDKFSWLRWDFPWVQGMRGGVRLDRERTRDLVRFLLEDSRTSKILLEVHLHRRLGVAHRKLRFQQLQAARHDDHIHVRVAR